jgi:hypothetical protein
MIVALGKKWNLEIRIFGIRLSRAYAADALATEAADSSRNRQMAQLNAPHHVDLQRRRRPAFHAIFSKHTESRTD